MYIYIYILLATKLYVIAHNHLLFFYVILDHGSWIIHLLCALESEPQLPRRGLAVSKRAAHSGQSPPRP